MKYRRNERGHNNRKNPNEDLTSVNDLAIEFTEGRESPYQRLN